jgi:DNA-directed RNA polymerase subunit M/transcription elongation factor TFIIS
VFIPRKGELDFRLKCGPMNQGFSDETRSPVSGGLKIMNDLFGGLSGALGGLVGGLAKSGLMPTDNPEAQAMLAATEVADLRKQQDALFAEIGRAAYAANPDGYEQSAKLKLLQENLAAAEQKAGAAKEAQEAAAAAEKAQTEARTCSSCGTVNPEGTKFCQECGSMVGPQAAQHCANCGVELAPGTRFCGSCGARQGE